MNTYFIIIGSHCDYIKAHNVQLMIRECKKIYGAYPEYAKKLIFN